MSGSNANVYILMGKPLSGWEPDDIRNWLRTNTKEQSLAYVYALASNRTRLLHHEFDDEDNPCPVEIFEAWWELQKELYAKIFASLEK